MHVGISAACLSGKNLIAIILIKTAMGSMHASLPHWRKDVWTFPVNGRKHLTVAVDIYDGRDEVHKVFAGVAESVC